jgi:uncharacterized protein DUF6600/FecR-like protein
MNQIKVWPHLTIVAVLCALIAGLGVAFYFKHEQNVQAEALPNAARIQRLDGEVAISDASNPNLQTNDGNEQWIAATPNQSFSVGDRIYTRENSHASLAFTGRNFARLNPNTGLDVLELSDDRTQLALRDGSAIFDVGYLNPGQLFEVGTPNGAVDFQEPGLYNVGFDNNGSVLVSALSGVAQIVGLGGSGRISKGELLTLVGQTAAQVALSRLNGRDAGYLVDDYYRYQYPNYYDGRYNNYDAYLNDPYYYDPYRHDVSYQYAPALIPGLNDLDYYGDWQDVSGYGHCWRPRVAADWAPYQQGYWVNDYPYGPTWVSSEAWGYAPYHYGRWANVNNQWFWVPDAVNSSPRYAPALVAFVPLTQANEIGWVPLAPGDPYAPRYYDQNWRPYYLTRADVRPQRVINLEVPGAVTVIPVDDFGRVVDARLIRRVDRQAFAGVRPVLDPLTLTPLRNAAVHSAWGRGKIDLPPGIAKKLHDTPVFVGSDVREPRFRKDLAKSLRVEPVPEKFRKQELKFDRKGEAARGNNQATRDAEAARRQQTEQLANEARRSNDQTRQQAREIERQQRKQEVEQRQAQQQTQQVRRQVQPKPAEQAPRAEQVGRRAGERPRVERPQMHREQQQPRLEQRQQRPAPQMNKHEMKQDIRQAQPQAQPPSAPRHESKGGQPAQATPPSQGHGGGKGKGKKGE